jgi:hypothetical protein
MSPYNFLTIKLNENNIEMKLVKDKRSRYLTQ